MGLLILLGQVSSDPLSGGAGWLGSGLLGAVLAWILFVNIPAKDKQILGLVDTRDKLAEKLTMEFKESLGMLIIKNYEREKELRDDFKNSLQKVVEHCEKEIGQVVASFRIEVNNLKLSVEELRRLTNERKGG